MFTMGTRLRSRYKPLLPSDGSYTKNDLHVVSSNLERCLMSVESLLAGLMPPQDDENPLPLPWQPIPVSIIPADRDYVSTASISDTDLTIGDNDLASLMLTKRRL